MIENEDVPVSKVNFSTEDCEVVLVGMKGNHLPFNDKCRNQRLRCCHQVCSRCVGH